MKLRTAVGLALLAMTMVLAHAAYADAIDDEARRIAQEVQCPVCQGASIADSPSALAAQMRGIVRSKLEAGESRDQILAYFVDRYGETVLMTPPRSGPGVIIWLAPYLAGVAILGLVYWMIQRRRSSPAPVQPTDPSLAPYLDEVDRAADLMRGEPLR